MGSPTKLLCGPDFSGPEIANFKRWKDPNSGTAIANAKHWTDPTYQAATKLSNLIVSEPRADIAAWVGERIGLKFEPPYACLAAIREGKIIGALVFQNWTEHDIEISVAADELPRSLLRSAFLYAAGQLGCQRFTCRTRADNHTAIASLKKLGAKEEGRQRGFFGDCDALLFGILKEDYPYGKLSKSPARA